MLVQNYKKIASYTYHAKGVINTHNSLLDFEYFLQGYTKGLFCKRHTTAQKMRFSIKDFFSKCDQIRIFMRIWPYLQKKSLIENFIFCAVIVSKIDLLETTILRRN